MALQICIKFNKEFYNIEYHSKNFTDVKLNKYVKIVSTMQAKYILKFIFVNLQFYTCIINLIESVNPAYLVSQPLLRILGTWPCSGHNGGCESGSWQSECPFYWKKGFKKFLEFFGILFLFFSHLVYAALWFELMTIKLLELYL